MNTTADPPLASARPPPKPLAYQSEIQQMMYVFGEVPEAIPQVTSLVEQIVQRHTIEMMSNAAATAKRRGAKTISVDDVVFLVRYDRSRVNRLKDYLGWKDVRKKANTDDKDDLDPLEDDAPDTTMATKKRVKFMWEYVKEFTDHLEDEVNEDDEENLEAFRDMMIRLKADDEATRKMTRAEYMFYSDCKTASFTHRKGKRFRDWAMTDQLGGGKPADDVIDVVGFLCYEMVRQITEMALQVRDQTSERTRLVQEALERALNKGFHPPDKSVPEEVNAGVLPVGAVASKSTGGAKKGVGSGDAPDSTTSLRVVPPHRSSTAAAAPPPLDDHHTLRQASTSPFINGLARGLSTASTTSAAASASAASTHAPPEMHSPAVSHSRLGSITEADHASGSGAGDPMDVDPAPKSADRGDRASTPAAAAKAEPATTPLADGKPLKGKAKKKAEPAAAAAAAKAAALDKEKAAATAAAAAADEATKSSAASGRGTKSTRGRKSKATLAREAKEAAAAAAAAAVAAKDKDKNDRDTSAPADPPSNSPAHTPVLSNAACARAAGGASGTPELLGDALRPYSRPPSDPPTPFRRPGTPAAPLPTTSALDHNAPSVASTPVRALLPPPPMHAWRAADGSGYFGQARAGVETPLSHVSVPLVLTTSVPMYSLFTEQWRESLPPPAPVSPADAGGSMDVDEEPTKEDARGVGGDGVGTAAGAAAAVDEGPVAPPPPRREPLQAAHVEEAYRRLMTAKCHTRMGRGSTRNAKPRRL